MLSDAHVTVLGRTVPYLSGITVHIFSGHADGRVVVCLTLLKLYFLVADRFFHPCGIDESILGTVAFGHNGDDSKHFTILMTCLLGLETD